MCSASALPAVDPVPCTTLKTPGGPPASRKSFAKSVAESGEICAGLRITELPMASAGATFHAAIING